MKEEAKMVMSTSSSLRGRSRRQPHQSSRPIYDTFRPRSDWSTTADAKVLTLYLPGFYKEQVTTRWEPETRMIRVQGQRPLSSYKWIRFDERLRVPEACDASNLHTQFVFGLLSVILPIIPIDNNADQEHEITRQELKPEEQEEIQIQDKEEEKQKLGGGIPKPAGKETGVKANAEASQEEVKLERTAFEASDEERKSSKWRSETTESKELWEKAENAAEKACVGRSESDAAEKKSIGKTTVEEMGSNGLEVSGGKECLVNVCVATLVIMGLGAWIFSGFMRCMISRL